MGCRATKSKADFGYTAEHDEYFWASINFYSNDDIDAYIAVRRRIIAAVYTVVLAECTRGHVEFIAGSHGCLYCALINLRDTCMQLQTEQQIAAARVKMNLWDTDAHSPPIRADINITAIYLADTIRYANLLHSYIRYADSGARFDVLQIAPIPALMKIYTLYFNR
jgi:hypothetical protein